MKNSDDEKFYFVQQVQRDIQDVAKQIGSIGTSLSGLKESHQKEFECNSKEHKDILVKLEDYSTRLTVLETEKKIWGKIIHPIVTPIMSLAAAVIGVSFKDWWSKLHVGP